MFYQQTLSGRIPTHILRLQCHAHFGNADVQLLRDSNSISYMKIKPLRRYDRNSS